MFNNCWLNNFGHLSPRRHGLTEGPKNGAIIIASRNRIILKKSTSHAALTEYKSILTCRLREICRLLVPLLYSCQVYVSNKHIYRQKLYRAIHVGYQTNHLTKRTDLVSFWYPSNTSTFRYNVFSRRNQEIYSEATFLSQLIQRPSLFFCPPAFCACAKKRLFLF